MKRGCRRIEKIDEFFFQKFEENSFFYRILSLFWFIPRNFIGKWYYRVLVRGICAIKGCDEHYNCGGNLPDDVCEWHCNRCSAEGINHVVYTYELFYSDTPLRNLIEALKGK